MTARYACPACRGSFDTDRFLAAGGLCPRCRRLLERASNGTPAPEAIAQTHPGPHELTHHPELDLPRSNWHEHPPGSALPHAPAGFTSPQQPLPQPAVDSDESVALLVTPVKGRRSEETPGRVARELPAITQLLNALGQVRPLCLEISGRSARRFLVVRCLRADAALVRAQLTGLYGAPEIGDLPPDLDPARLFTEPGISSATTRLGLARPEALPLRGYDELLENDTLLPILGALVDAGEGEAGLAQVLIHGPAGERWAEAYTQELLAMRRNPGGGALSPRTVLKVALGFWGVGLLAIYFLLGEWLSLFWLLALGTGLVWVALRFLNGSGLNWNSASEELVERKVRQNGYRTEVRLAAAAQNLERAAALLAALEGAYRVFGAEAGNRLERQKHSLPFAPADLAPYGPESMILGDEEIAALWHLPVRNLPDRLHAVRVDAVLPDPGRIARSPENTWRLGRMGKSAGAELPVYLPRAAITRTHALFMGKTRTGKTTGLENAIRELAAEPGRSIVAIDPHDDMVSDLLGLIPPERVDDVVYVNFADPERIPTLNLLDVNLFEGDPERTAEALGEVARAVFKKYWGPRMDVVFERTALALALANTLRPADQQYTILDGLALLNMNKEARQAFLQRALPTGDVLTAVLRSYFRLEFESLSHSMREQVIMPVLSKLRPFESNTHLLACFGSPASSLDPIAAVREGKILLVRTGATVLSQEYSNFIGSLLLNLVRRAIFSQAETAPEKRIPVTVIVDESQSFTGVDYGAALAQAAKFGGNLILTTQGAGFIGRSVASDETDDPQAFSKILSNVDTLVVYRVSGEDAVGLVESEFVGELSPPDLIYLPDHQAFVRFKKDGQLVGPFRVSMDPPPPRDELVRAAVLAGRARYTCDLAEALAQAERAGRRLETYFGSLLAAETAAYDGEIAAADLPAGPERTALTETQAAVEPGVGQPSRPARVPVPTPPEVDAIMGEGFVGLGGEPGQPGPGRGVPLPSGGSEPRESQPRPVDLFDQLDGLNYGLPKEDENDDGSETGP